MSGMKPLPCPCPWCGGTKVCAAMRRKLRYFVVCEGIECSAEGPTKNTAREAIREWNRVAAKTEALELLVSDIQSLGNPPAQLLVALAKAEEALAGVKP